MKRNVGVKLCVVVLIALIVYSMLASSAMALTREDVITKFLAQKDIKDFKESMSYEVNVTSNQKAGIDVKIAMGIESYENSFTFDGSTCKIILKSNEDELGKKLLKNMWAACAEIGNENGVKTEAITGESGENALDTFWTKFTEKVNNGEDTYGAYGVKIEKDSNDSYVGTINTQMYKVDLTDLTSTSYESKTNNKTSNNTSNITTKEYTSNVNRIPNAGNNQDVINVFRVIAFVAVAAIIAFSVYNVKSKK